MLQEHAVGIALNDGQNIVQFMRHVAPDLVRLFRLWRFRCNWASVAASKVGTIFW